jgi:hypothetical protein
MIAELTGRTPSTAVHETAVIRKSCL